MTTDYNGRIIWGGSSGSPVSTYDVDSDRRDIDVSSKIADLMPEATPFLSILVKARKDPVNSTEFIWYDEEEQKWWTELDEAYAANTAHESGTIELKNTDFIRPKDVLKNASTGEIMRVLSISGNEVSVIRGSGYKDNPDINDGTNAVASSGADDNIIRLGNAMEEGSNAPETHATQPTKLFNYVQTFRTPFDATLENQLEGKRAGESPRVRLRKRKLIAHRIDMEKQFMWGERYEDISSRTKMTGGLMQFIRSNAYDVGTTNAGVLTEAEWENFCEMAFDWGSQDQKLFLTSPRIGSIINQFAAGRIQTTSEEETYGMRLKRYISFHGDIIIATTKLFEKNYANMGLALDMENISYRPFGGYDSKLRANIQENDLLGWKDEYVTMAGLKVRKEKTHAVLTGVTA